MRSLPFLVILLNEAPAFAAHGSVAHPRTAPEPSDIALFVLAAIGVWVVRRAMRTRFAKNRAEEPSAKD